MMTVPVGIGMMLIALAPRDPEPDTWRRWLRGRRRLPVRRA